MGPKDWKFYNVPGNDPILLSRQKQKQKQTLENQQEISQKQQETTLQNQRFMSQKQQVQTEQNHQQKLGNPTLLSMCGSCHIQNILIGVKYQNCCRTLDVYLLFATWMRANSIKTDLRICNLWTGQFVSL